MPDKLRCAVVGVGYLGRFHAEKYAALEDCELVAVVDTNLHRAKEAASSLDCQALGNIDDLPEVDAVSVVVPTIHHFEVAAFCLGRGCHVLVEKPIASTLGQADRLIEAAKAAGRVLMVGHLERFNGAWLAALNDGLSQPRFIESHRLARFKPRAVDVDVVLDLMIHDIDIVLALVESEIVRLDASGVAVLTDEVDIANARLKFANGCVANITASRVSLKDERKMRLFLANRYVSVDFRTRRFSMGWNEGGEIQVRQVQSRETDPLLAEICHFIDCIRGKCPPLVPGEAGRRALATALEITNVLNQP